MGLRMPEILLIMAVLLLLFGATRLPQLGSSLGSAIRNFKKGFGGEGEEGTEKSAEKDASKLGSDTTATAKDAQKVASKQG